MVEIIESPRTLIGGQAVHNDITSKSLVDWLQVTFTGEKTWSEILHILGLSKVEFMKFETGYYGYPNMYGMGNINIMYRDNLAEYHIQMTGQGCRMFEQVSEKSWVQLLSYIQDDPNAKLTRIDLAIDDFKGMFTIPTIRRKIKRGELVSKFTKAKAIEEFRLMTDELGNSPVTGDGVRFGSDSSRLVIRMYDKLLERQNQGFDVTVNKWVRVELQLRKEYANEALRELILNDFAIGLVAKGYLKEYLRFVDKTATDSNKRRWKDSHFWAVYMKNIEPLKLSLQAPDKTIERSIKWLDHSIAPSLAMVYEAKGEGFFNRFVDDMKTEGKKRMKKKHEVMVNDHLENEKIKRQINKNQMNELKKKMATIRKNRSQKMNEKNNRMVLKNYSMVSKVKPEDYGQSVLEKPKKRITFLHDDSK